MQEKKDSYLVFIEGWCNYRGLLFPKEVSIISFPTRHSETVVKIAPPENFREKAIPTAFSWATGDHGIPWDAEGTHMSMLIIKLRQFGEEAGILYCYGPTMQRLLEALVTVKIEDISTELYLGIAPKLDAYCCHHLQKRQIQNTQYDCALNNACRLRELYFMKRDLVSRSCFCHQCPVHGRKDS